MRIRAKFKCNGIKQSEGWAQDLATDKYLPAVVETATFAPVVGNDKENKKFFASTPSGQIEIGTVRGGIFELGKEYYIDFTAVE